MHVLDIIRAQKMSPKSIFLCLSLCSMWLPSSSTQNLGNPYGCVYNRLDAYPCNIVNPASTDIPEENEYAIYSTRIKPGNDGMECIIRSRDDVVEPIDTIVRTTDTIGGDPRVYYLFSPGLELASPVNYGNQQLIKYRVQCDENHFAFFNLTFLELEEANCMDLNYPEPRCVDYLRVTRGGEGSSGFGFIETCGTTIPPEMNSQLDTSTIEITLRTSDTDRRSGFRATVVCVDNQLLTGVDHNSGDRKRAAQFAARVKRQEEYVDRMRRSALQPGSEQEAVNTVQKFNIPYRQGLTYTNGVVRIINMENRAIISRLPSLVNRLVVMDGNGRQLEFFRKASSTFSGPGRLTRIGVYVFFEQVTTIPDLGGIPKEAVIPKGHEASVTGTLLEAHTNLILEQDSEQLSLKQLEPPSFKETILNHLLTRGRRRRSTHTEGRRVRRKAETPRPTQCKYNDSILGEAILNQNTYNPVLHTVVNVILKCTEREEPGRLQRISRVIVIDIEFDRSRYRVKELAGSVDVCLIITTEGFLPRAISVLLTTHDGSATAPHDYQPVSTVVRFPRGAKSGVSSRSQQCVTIVINNNNLPEESKKFQVTAATKDLNVNLPSPTSVEIVDDD